MIHLPANAMQNPLPDIAVQMQQQVADGIRIRRVAQPQLFGSQHLDASLDAPHQLRQLLRGKIQELGFDAHR
jgi:hypothetical protein